MISQTRQTSRRRKRKTSLLLPFSLSLSLKPQSSSWLCNRKIQKKKNSMVLLLNALTLARTMMVSTNDLVFEAEDIAFGKPWWFVYAGVSCLLVLFAGIMSGLTLGLMSLNLVELEILQRSGTSTEKKQAGSSILLNFIISQRNLWF